MFLELNQLRGAREHFERRFEPAEFDPQDEDYRVAAPVDLSMDIEKVGTDAFRVKGRAATKVELQCSRCLENFEMPLVTSFVMCRRSTPTPSRNARLRKTI